MDRDTCLSKMIAPGTPRMGKYRNGVIQICITRACDKSCFHCTQGANFGGKPHIMSVEQFEQACKSLEGYWGVVGVFGGNPAIHPRFGDICAVMRQYIPFPQRGLWCNNLINESKAKAARETFNPAVSNLNVHMDRQAWQLFKTYWPEARPFGVSGDSRHSPVFVSMKDLGIPEEKRWELISSCDINQHWSALIGTFRGDLRAWFCEVAGSQAMLHQNDPDYPDTGIDPLIETYPSRYKWWQLPMVCFANQVDTHCHDCGVPLRGRGELAMSNNSDSVEQVSSVHSNIAKPKSKDRQVQIVTTPEQLGAKLKSTIDYLGNAVR